MSALREAAYYNERWEAFQYADGHELTRAVAILEALRSVNLQAPRICDLGCGSGWFASMLACVGPTVAVDQSDAAVRLAASRYPTADFRTADIFRWDAPADAFDVVVSQEVIEHVDDQARYLDVAHRLLRRGGRLILTTPNHTTVMAMPAAQRSRQPIENWLDAPRLRSLAEARFADVAITTIVSGYGTTGLHRLINSHKLHRLADACGLGGAWRRATLRCGFGLHLVLTARKP